MKTKTYIPLPIIKVKEEDRIIPTFKRFLCPWTWTDHRTPIGTLLTTARCHEGLSSRKIPRMHPNVQNHPGRKRFVLVQYEPEGITAEEAIRSLWNGYIRPATLQEMLAVTGQHLAMFERATIIALGSSNIKSPELAFASQSCWYRAFTSQKRHLRWQKTVEVFPSLRWAGDNSHLHLTKGAGGWKSENLYLGVVREREFDQDLVDMKISVQNYLELPDHNFYPNLEHAPLEAMYVAESGYICEVVRGSQMFKKQQTHSRTPTPKIGLRCYRPVFTDI